VKRRALLAAVAVLVVILAGLWYAFAGHRQPAGQVPLADLTATTLPTLQEDFNRHADEVRVILLLSPT
jgi:hypothetical protein